MNPPDDEPEAPQEAIPSMLHHIDKTNLENYQLDHIFDKYDDANAVYFE